LSNVPTYRHHYHHKHQGLDPLIPSVSIVTTALANVSSVFQLFSFLVVYSDMISKGFGLVAFFASVKASSVCIHLTCLVCIQSVVHGVRSRVFPYIRNRMLFVKDAGVRQYILLTSVASSKLPMSMEHWWNDTDSRKPKYSDINLSN